MTDATHDDTVDWNRFWRAADDDGGFGSSSTRRARSRTGGSATRSTRGSEASGR
jgi:hypothetical protein